MCDIAICANGAIALDWTAGAGADHYRIYFKTSAGSYQYFDTADSSTSYTISTATGATTGDPNLTASSVVFGQFRVKWALSSGTLWHYGPWVSPSLGNSTWEIIDAGEMPGTPQPSLWGSDPIGWLAALECKHATATPTMSVDVLIPVPTDQDVLDLYYNDRTTTGPTANLGTKRDWLYDQRPDRRASTVLFETGTSTEAGEFVREGELRIGPVATELVFMALIDGLVSNVTDAKFKLTLDYTPLFEYLAGP